MYSLMSMRIIASSSPNTTSARALASSVLPTPVGPRNRKVAIGRLPWRSPARARRTASLTAVIASCWPITRWCRRSSICRSFSRSSAVSSVTGMPVSLEMISAMSSTRTSSVFDPWVCCQRSVICSRCSLRSWMRFSKTFASSYHLRLAA